MPLTDRQIREVMAPRMRGTFREGTGGKGLISCGLTSAGYDFRLAQTVKLYRRPRRTFFDRLFRRPLAVIDPKNIDPKLFVTLPLEFSGPCTGNYWTNSRFVTLPPYGYALAETVEYVDIPDDLEIIVVGKSTYARSGIIVNCTPLEPGWRGVTTLEIANATPLPARLYIGEGIAQAKFYRLDEKPEKTYEGKGFGKYQDQTGLTLPTV